MERKTFLSRILIMGTLLLTMSFQLVAQIKMSGKVVDNNNEPIIGASVAIKGTNTGTITDLNGLYQIEVPASGKTVVFSYIGMKSQELQVKAGVLNVTLSEDARNLDEVVVVGYGAVKKTDLTGAVGSATNQQLTQKGTLTPLQALQGSIAGANIQQTSSRAGSSFNIQIRGNASLKTDTKPLFVVDGVVMSDIDFLNPQDIERLDVLKDASSLAIYGSRGTGGVVMVTTKKAGTIGQESKPTITYDGYYGTTNLTRIPDFFNAQEYADWRFQRFMKYDAVKAQPLYYIDQSNYEQSYLVYETGGNKFKLWDMLNNNESYDWKGLVTQQGIQQNHYVSVSGATKNSGYAFGGGYQEEKGVYLSDMQRRYNFKASVDSKVNSYISAGININVSVINGTEGSDKAVEDAFDMNPFFIPYDSLGAPVLRPGNKIILGTVASGRQFSDYTNPLITNANWTEEYSRVNLFGNAFIQIQPVKGLTLKSTFMPRLYSGFSGTFERYIEPVTRFNKASLSNSNSLDWTWDNQINYNIKIANDHNLGLMGVMSAFKQTSHSNAFAGFNVEEGTLWYNMKNSVIGDVPIPGSTTVPPAVDKLIPELSSSYTESSLLSYAFRLNYDFKGKYLFSGSMRTDGSSRFHKDHRWSYFPAASFAWRVTEESFMENVKPVMDNLKLRIGYGNTGNNNVGNYAIHTTVSGPNYYAFGNTSAMGYYPSGLVNAALTWEKTSEVNIGLDFGLFDSQISGTVDLYNKISSDLLGTRQLPLEAGGITMTDNVSKVQNKGIEVSLSTYPVRTKDLTINISANIAYNKNSILEVDGKKEDNIGNKWFIGQPNGVIYDYVWGGIVTDQDMIIPDNTAGAAYATKLGVNVGDNVKMYDYYFDRYARVEGMPYIIDQNGDGKIDDLDKKILGHITPDITGSLSASINYKNWDLSAQVYLSLGGYVKSPFLDRYVDEYSRGLQQIDMDYYIPKGVLIGAKGVNTDGTYIDPVYQAETHYGNYPFPSQTATNGGWGGDIYKALSTYTETSYAKMKFISLGYTLPSKWLKKAEVNSLRLYATVTNPYTWTNYIGFDPEWADASRSKGGPATITTQIGMKLKF